MAKFLLHSFLGRNLYYTANVDLFLLFTIVKQKEENDEFSLHRGRACFKKNI